MISNNRKERIAALFKYSRRNLPIIIAVLFWFAISIFLVNFVNTIFYSTQDEVIEKEKILIFFLIILSVFLLVIITFYIMRLFYAMIRNRFGARMRFKLTIFFVFVALLPIIPFIQIGTRFIESSMNLWFSEDIGTALDLSEEVIKAYYQEKKDVLSENASTFNSDMGNRRISWDNLLEKVKRIQREGGLPNISIWTVKGDMIEQAGTPLFSYNPGSPPLFRDTRSLELQIDETGVFTVSRNESNYLIMPGKLVSNESGDIIGFINFAAPIVPGFDTITGKIDSALRSYNTVSVYKVFFTRGFSILFIGVIFPIILIVLIISLFLTREFLDPISNLARATKRIADGDFNFQIDSSFSDEFKVLAESFNSMIHELEVSRKKIKQGEKIATWQEIARRLAHELKNPLTPIQLSSERILKKYRENSPDFEQVLGKGVQTIIAEVDHMNRLLAQFSEFASWPRTSKKPGGILAILKDVIDLFSNNKYNIRIDLITGRPDYTLLLDETQIKSVFSNLIKNAIEAMQKPGTITVTCEEKRIGFTEHLVISVEDQGSGIVIKSKEDVFEPYFSTKENGAGLGLSSVQRIVHEHEGRIYYKSKRGFGTTFIVEIPLAP
jgi:two-component system nitrogen regulation sensor histidine kinase NtrY